MKVYKLRHKQTGEFYGNSKGGKVYGMIGHARNAMTSLWKTVHLYLMVGDRYTYPYPSEYEIVEYELVEVATHEVKK